MGTGNAGITRLGFVDGAVKCSLDTHDSQGEIEAMTAKSQPVPKPWKDLMDKAGIRSIRHLSQVAEIKTTSGEPDHTRANAVIMRGGTTSPENMGKLAAALRVPVEELYRITSGVAARPLTMPAGTEKLSERAKNALAEVIRVMIEEREQNDEKSLDKKSSEPAERVQEKNDVRPMTAQEEYSLAARRELFPARSKVRGKAAEKRE